MSTNLNEILATADWKELTPNLLYYGDKLISRCVWRGLVVITQPDGKVCVEGFGADDFLQESIDSSRYISTCWLVRLCKGI